MLILARHGQTAANAAGLLLGRADPPLTELGRAQAARIAAVVAPLDVARVVASPLLRARETAAALGRPVDVDERWIEIDYGVFEGERLRDVPSEVWRKWRADPRYAPQDGESLAALGERVRAACADLVEEAAERDVVVVSHVSPIKAAVAWALEVDDGIAWRMFLDVAALCRIAVGPSGASLRAFNDVSHLSGLGIGSSS